MADKKTSGTQRDWNYPRHRNTQTMIRLTEADKSLLVRLAGEMGLSMNDVVMLLVRAEFKRRKLDP
jgi:hypothetical protein